MSWNGNGGGGPQGPWGQGPRPPNPPDFDKVIRMARERFAGKTPPGSQRVIGLIVLAILVSIWGLGTGIYIVAPGEQGVVVRFGRYVDTYGPGPHIKLPWPIDVVYTPDVESIQRIEVGYRTRLGRSVDVSEESLMLTGDENIVDIDLSVQYKVKNAPDFLFNVRNPQRDLSKVVHNAAETALRQVIGRNLIDTALTAGKERIQDQTRAIMQEILDSYQSGISIQGVQLQQVAPPAEVIDAFKDVASAREDRERAINEAQGYANDILPKANGEAAKMVQEAEAYKTAKVSRAEGDAQRFLSLLAEYAKAPEVTATRLYLETMEKILAQANKVIVDPKAGSGVLPYLSLDRLGGPERGGPR
ncbi:MAG: FtsH protease activity modulator HflK [Magnetococcales bacterium]|nr:FtsH protease activity modulator HflK [Magnetococcales bacterium]